MRFLAFALPFAALVPLWAAPVRGGTPTGDLHRHYVFAATGEDKPYRLYVPASYRAGKPMPLIVVLHGAGEDENGPMDRSDLRTLAEPPPDGRSLP